MPHMDGGHLFRETHGFSVDAPVHITNVFVPLVDLTLEAHLAVSSSELQ